MANDKLISYIETQLRKGISSDKIKSKLLDAGHKLEKVEEAFAHAHKRSNIGKVIITIAVLFILVAIIFMVKIPEKKVVEEIAGTTTTTIAEQISKYGFDTYAYDNLLTKALEQKDFNICDGIDRLDIKQECKDVIILMKAVEEKNIALCDEINSKGRKEECKKQAGK